MPETRKYKDYIEHYKIDAEQFDYFRCDYPSREAVERYRAKLAASAVRLDRGGVVLDVGCGGGMLVGELIGAGARVVGMDLSLANLKRVKSGLGKPHFHPVVADIYHPPFGRNCFQAVFLSSLLEHLELPEKALKHSAALLQEGGHLVIIVPHKEKIRYHLCIHCNRPTPGFAHLHSFDESRLVGLLNASGLGLTHLEAFGNKFLELLGASSWLSYLPFVLWRGVDRLLNLVFRRTQFLLVVAKIPELSDPA